MTGRAEPGSEIRIYLDNEFLGAAESDDQGEWRYAPENPIPAGQHTLRLDQVLEGGDVQLRIEQPFNREKPLNTRLAEGQVKIQPGNNLWEVARRIYGSGILYTLIFRENKDQIRDPDLIYPEQVFTLPSADGGDSTEMTN
jgi:nucleoid-associated protein YgaU